MVIDSAMQTRSQTATTNLVSRKKLHPTFDTLPFDVTRQIIKHLNVGHVIPLLSVCRLFYQMIKPDHDFWRSRLQRDLNVKVSKTNKTMDPFTEIVKRFSSLRCNDCGIMRGPPNRPFVDGFFNLTVCRDCYNHKKYRLITAFTAKKNYFLNEKDLLGLRTVSRINPHYKNGSFVRLYSREAIAEASASKLKKKGITLRERRALQQKRSQATKDRIARDRGPRRGDVGLVV